MKESLSLILSLLALCGFVKLVLAKRKRKPNKVKYLSLDKEGIKVTYEHSK